MVHLDSHKRSAEYFFWRRVLLSLTVFSVLYIGVVRPLQSLIVDQIIFPKVSEVDLEYENVHIGKGVDKIYLITQWPKPGQNTRIELPFNGHACLALALFWGAGNRKLIRILLIYQFVLIFVMPVAGLLILEGHRWMIVAANVHDKVYKALFIIVGLLALRSAVLSLKKETPA